MHSLLLVAILSASAHAYTENQCNRLRLDRARCQQEIRDGSRDPDRPCPSVPRECFGGGGGISDCDAQRLDYAMCLNNARSSGLPDSVCGTAPTCGN